VDISSIRNDARPFLKSDVYWVSDEAIRLALGTSHDMPRISRPSRAERPFILVLDQVVGPQDKVRRYCANISR